MHSKINYIDYSKDKVEKYRRPKAYPYFLIRNGKPYRMPRSKIIFLLGIHLITLVYLVLKVYHASNKVKYLWMILIGILLTDFLSSLAHAVSDIRKSEGYTRRPDFKGKKIKVTTLHHIDVLDMLDCTSSELLSWVFHVGLDKTIYAAFLLAILDLRFGFKWDFSYLIMILFTVNCFMMHQEYFHGLIHVYHHHGKIPKSVQKLYDWKLLAYPEYHKQHHTVSNQNWGVFIGLFDPLIKLFYPTKYVEHIKPAQINDKSDDRLCIPSLGGYWKNVSKDLYHDRKYTREAGWGYCHPSQKK